MSDYDSDLLHEGIFHFRAKEFEMARKYFERALDVADDLQTRAQTNYYLSLLTDDPVQKRKYLEETLSNDMNHAEARRALAVLDGKLKISDIVNPDKLPAPAAGTMTVQVDRFTCPKCGGRMVFAPDGVSLICEFCNQSQRLSGVARAGGQDFFIAMANGSGQRVQEQVQTFQCQGCGATFILAPDQISATCAYCGSVHVVALDEKRQMVEPDSILPMAFDQKQASCHLVHWMEGMKIKPQGQVQALRGLYMPVWSFDISGSFPWTGMVDRNNRQEPVSGDVDVHFNDIRILGSQKMADLMVKTLPDYDLSLAVAYDARFLAGWMAEVYDLPMAEASLDARQTSVENIRVMIFRKFGHVHDLGYSTAELMIGAFKLILVPAWVTEIETRDRTVRVLINGQTASVHSEFPERGLAGWLDNLLGSR